MYTEHALQACSLCLQVSARSNTVVSSWRTSWAGGFRGTMSTTFRSSSSLVIRRTRLSTVGDRNFPVAATRVWNSLPQHVTSAQSLPVFRRCFPWLCRCAWEVTLSFSETLIVFLLTYLLTLSGSDGDQSSRWGAVVSLDSHRTVPAATNVSSIDQLVDRWIL